MKLKRHQRELVVILLITVLFMVYSFKKSTECVIKTALVCKCKGDVVRRGYQEHVESSLKSLSFLSDSPTKKNQKWLWEGAKVIERCSKRDWYNTGPLPKASVVIPFIDSEVLSTLLRTVLTILKYTPDHLLEEIILVGDNCKRDDLHELLQVYVENISGGDRVHILHSNVSLGSPRARLYGIRKAKGQVVVSLDSHIEVQPNWLEPLLYEIKSDRKVLVSSFLDWLEMDETSNHWLHSHGPTDWVTFFDLTLTFGFKKIDKNLAELRDKGKIDPTSPVRSPMTIGNWAIDKSYFTEIGELDEGMEFWGADNLDISIRTWLFGGRVLNVPCSKTAHVEVPRARNYRNNKEKFMFKNYKRVLKVWMPDYLQYFEQYQPKLKDVQTGDLTSRMMLRQQAKHNFTWFLENIFPEFGIPELHGLALGQIQHVGTGTCLAIKQEHAVGESCNTNQDNKDFYWSRSRHWIRSPFYLLNARPQVVNSTLGTEDYISWFNSSVITWIHWKKGPLKVKDTDLCLQLLAENLFAQLAKCEPNEPNQHWSFTEYPPQFRQERAAINKQYRLKYIKDLET